MISRLHQPGRSPRDQAERGGGPRASGDTDRRNQQQFGAERPGHRTERVPAVHPPERRAEAAPRLLESGGQQRHRRAHRGGGNHQDEEPGDEAGGVHGPGLGFGDGKIRREIGQSRQNVGNQNARCGDGEFSSRIREEEPSDAHAEPRDERSANGGPPMKLDNTSVVDQTLLPRTRPARWNQAVSKTSPAAPESRQTTAREKGVVCSVAGISARSGEPILTFIMSTLA